MDWPVLLLLALSQEVPDDLPPLLKARALLASIANKPLSGPVAFEVARQAYTSAKQADLGVEPKDFPNASEFLGPPELTVAQAWLAYEKHRDPAATTRLPFPPRLKSSAARCDQEVVDDPEAYLKLAQQAGPDEFAAALVTLRSPVEIGSALAMLTQWDDPRAVTLGMELVRRLRRAVTSKREYDAARDLKSQVLRFSAFAPAQFRDEIEEATQYYENRNQLLPACAAAGRPMEDGSDRAFSEWKRRVLSIDSSATSEFEFVETLLRLFHLAAGDSSRLDELESAGNARLRLLIHQLRQRQKQH